MSLPPQTALLCDSQCVQPRRFAILRITPTIPKAELEATHCRKKRQTRFIRACRFIFINITLSNRIVKPNNRYTRQPASHDFLFYSAPDKVYVLTATNRIAMRFAVRSAPPFRYRTKRTDYSTGGTWSGTLPQAESEAAHCRKKRSQHITVTALYCLLLYLTPPFN